jgi:isoleucyl-tRNA synthetase
VNFLIFREAKEGTQALSNRFISIDLDCQLTDELVDEGLARECINRIQRTRKELGLNVEDRIKITFTSESNRLKDAILKHKDYICGETLALSLSEDSANKNAQSFSIDEHDLTLDIAKA